MKNTTTILGICLLSFVLYGCGNDSPPSGGQTAGSNVGGGSGGGSGAEGDSSVHYTLTEARVENKCSRMENEIRDIFGAECISIDVNENDNDAVVTTNQRILSLGQSMRQGEALCKWTSQSGRNQICKIPAVAYIVKQDFINQYNRMRQCTGEQRGAVSRYLRTKCVGMIEKPYPGQGSWTKVIVSDAKLVEHINSAIKDDASLCVYVNMSKPGGGGLIDHLCKI